MASAVIGMGLALGGCGDRTAPTADPVAATPAPAVPVEPPPPTLAAQHETVLVELGAQVEI
jgi:hypothetical protein